MCVSGLDCSGELAGAGAMVLLGVSAGDWSGAGVSARAGVPGDRAAGALWASRGGSASTFLCRRGNPGVVVVGEGCSGAAVQSAEHVVGWGVDDFAGDCGVYGIVSGGVCGEVLKAGMRRTLRSSKATA